MIMYLLDKQQNIIKALDNTIVEASMIEEINAANKLTFSVMTNSRIDISIHYVCIPAPKGEEFLLFKLISETVKNDRVEYTAVESAYDELKSYAYIKDVRPQDRTAGEMLTQILQGTRWSLGYIADTARASTNFYYITVLEAIQKIVELFNVELTFTVNIDKKTNVISSRRINLYTQQGRRLGKRFEYGSNLLEVTREQSSEDLITALVGRGKGEEVSQGEDGSPDGYGRRITFADIEWKKANGNPTDKPKGQEYVEDKDATALYGFSDGKPRIGLTTFEDITDPQELLKATWASLQVAKRPKVSFKASVLDVGDLELGDTVAIIRHDLGIEYFTRVYKVDHDLLDKNNNTIELGDDFSQKSLTNYVSDVAKITENARNTAEYAVSSANGKNKNYYSKSKPQYANEGDNLFLDLGNGETEYYVWHDGNWELVLSTADTTRVQKQVEEVQKDIADARVEADRLSQEQSKTAKELSDKITDISDKAIKNTSDIKSVTDDIANVHADYVSQQANLNQQKQDLDQARQDLLSNSNRIDKLSVGLDSVNINVNNVNSKIDNIKVGGTNLIPHSEVDTIRGDTDYWVFSTGNINNYGGRYNPTDKSLELEAHIKDTNYQFLQWQQQNNVLMNTELAHLQVGDVLTISAEVYIQNPNMSGNITLGFRVNPRTNYNSYFSTERGIDLRNLKTGWQRVSATGTITQKYLDCMNDVQLMRILLAANGLKENNKIAFRKIKAEKGNIATDWSPAPEDMTDKIEVLSGKVTANSNEFSSVYTKITNAKNDAVNAIKGDSQWQSMGKIVTNASFLQNANGFAQEVSKRITNDTGQTNLYYNSEFTYSNGNNHNVDGIISTGNIAYSENGRYANYKGSNSMREYTTGGLSDYKYIEHTKDNYVKASPGEIVSGSVTVWTTGDSSVPRNGYAICTISFYKDLSSGRMGYKEVSVAAKDIAYPNFRTLKVENVTVPDGANYMTLFLIVRGAADWHFSQPMLVKDSHVGTYVPSTQLQLNQVIDTADSHTRTISDYLTGSNSRFTQLSNNVNLKVNKGDVIGQINLEAGRTLLQNQKIYLDADTVGFSGKAFIPSAAIKDLDAGKITTGTLDAANVNVINLNANNITSGSIKGTNLDIDLNSGNVSFQSGRIHDSNNYVDINIDEGYISTANNLGRLLFKENSLQIAGYNTFDHTDDYYLKIDNGMNGGSWAGANITGRDYISISNKANSDGFSQINAIIQTNFAGISAGKSTFGWEPTFVGGADRGVYIAGGKKFSSPNPYKLDEMPSILIGTNQSGDGWYSNRVIINGSYVHIPETYNKTTSAAPNVYVANDGALVRSTSAAKYKTDIVRSHDLDYGNKILNVPIATWIDKAEAERYAKKESEQEPVRHFGMIADDLASAGLEMLVTRNNDGELEGIQYDRIAPALIPVISNLKTRLELLERKLLNE